MFGCPFVVRCVSISFIHCVYAIVCCSALSNPTSLAWLLHAFFFPEFNETVPLTVVPPDPELEKLLGRPQVTADGFVLWTFPHGLNLQLHLGNGQNNTRPIPSDSATAKERFSRRSLFCRQNK